MTHVPTHEPTQAKRGQGTKIIRNSDDLKAATAPGLYRVEGQTGLYLQVKGTNSRSWIYRYSFNGKVREKGVGSARTMGLTEAKRKAQKLAVEVAEGRDPLAEKPKTVIAVKTLKAAAEEYIATHAAGWTPIHAEQWKSTLATYVYPSLGEKRCDAITPEEVLAVLTPIWSEINETASRVRGRIETVIEAEYAFRPWPGYRNPADWSILKHKLIAPKKIRVVQHHPAVPVKDAPAVFAKIAGQGGMGALALRFLILIGSGARTKTVRGARWSEFDFDERVWNVEPFVVEDGKKADTRGTKGQKVAIVIPDAAMAILREVEKARRPDDLVFPGTKPGEPLSDMTLLMVHKRLTIAETVHGWRATFKSWASTMTEYPRELVEEQLGHAIGNAVEQAYDRERRIVRRGPMMEAWADYLLSKSA